VSLTIYNQLVGVCNSVWNGRLFVLLSAQIGDELHRIKQEIEERGNSMSDGGNITDMLPLISDHTMSRNIHRYNCRQSTKLRFSLMMLSAFMNKWFVVPFLAIDRLLKWYIANDSAAVSTARRMWPGFCLFSSMRLSYYEGTPSESGMGVLTCYRLWTFYIFLWAGGDLLTWLISGRKTWVKYGLSGNVLYMK